MSDSGWEGDYWNGWFRTQHFWEDGGYRVQMSYRPGARKALKLAALVDTMQKNSCSVVKLRREDDAE